jgi:TM2 domain-containing membrane protein YozV
LGLIFWVLNSFQAYHHANMTQPDAFQGIQSFWLPVAASLLVPGWGQFLNGQPKKGSYFLIFTVVGCLSIPSLMLIPWLWSSLETAKDRLLLEGSLVMGFVLLIPVFFMWLLSVYDALKVSMDPLKKEPIRKRIKYAANRLRAKGWGRGVLPQAKLILMLSLFLVLSLTLSYYYFPQRYYTALLDNLQSQLSHKEMVLIPHLINKLLQITTPQQPHH